MSDHLSRYDGLTERFTAWAATRPDVRAAFIVGSRAREVFPADEWSDIDVVTFADTPGVLLDDREWLFHIGHPEITYREPTAVGIWEERRVLFADGCDADFSVLPARLIDELARTSPGGDLYDQTSGVVARGYRVLVDKDGSLVPVLRMLASTAPPRSPRPTQERFDEVLSNFWYHCVGIARKLRRGERVVAHQALERTQREMLVIVIRWLAARDIDTWHATRFFERWAPEPIGERFTRTYARNDDEDIQRALAEMMDLASWLADELANTYLLTVNPGPEQAARRWVTETMAR